MEIGDWAATPELNGIARGEGGAKLAKWSPDAVDDVERGNHAFTPAEAARSTGAPGPACRSAGAGSDETP